MKNFDQNNDPRLSAYAFGELSGDAKSEVEQLLKQDPEAQAEVDALREFAGLLKTELATEPAGELDSERLENVMQGGNVIASEPDTFSRFSKGISILAVAACLCLLTVVGMKNWMKTDSKEAEDHVLSEMRESSPPALFERADSSSTPSAVTVANSAKPEPDASPEPSSPIFKEGNSLGIDQEKMPVKRERSEVASAGSIPENKADKRSQGGIKAKDEGKKLPGSMRGADRDGKMLESSEILLDSAPAEEAPMPAAAATPAPVTKSKSLLSKLESDAAAPKRKPTATRRMALPVDGIEPGAKFGRGFGSGGAGGGFGFEDADIDESIRGGRPARPSVSSNEDYGKLTDNAFKQSIKEPLSTFSIDVDTGAYSNLRRMIMKQSAMPPKDAVRIEEMINYFDYDYPQPEEEHPFSVDVDVADCPWAPEFRLVKIGLKAKEIHVDERPASNLVFLIDVSGSMNNPDKLPLLKQSMIALTRKLGENDKIGIVVYAGSSGVVLEPTSGEERKTVEAALERLSAGGSTNGGEGIQRAYQMAKANFIEGGVNRVILATDGDLNVGITKTDDLVKMVRDKVVDDAIFLTVLGFGSGNLKESRMEQLANKGNGNYFYIDSAKEARRVLVEKLSSTLVAVAKDVKIQVDFNPGQVSEYRLIGYANRMLKAEDFADDTKDAGEIGAGHTVTALYQVLPASSERARAKANAHKSKYIVESDEVEKKADDVKLAESNEMLTVKLRYKQPEADKSTEFEVPVIDKEGTWQEADDDFQFAAAVAGYGMLLRESEFKGKLSYKLVRELADEGKGEDKSGMRQEFLDILGRTEAIQESR